MAEYELEITLTANRKEEPLVPLSASDALEVEHSGVNLQQTIKSMGKMIRQAAPGNSAPALGGDGFAFQKTIVLRAESFAALAAVLEKFYALAEQIEIESQVKHS